tara:strand:+ start:38 stop:1504 length:1467 start_codon:yes stop_codon:yes gene_type:complete
MANFTDSLATVLADEFGIVESKIVDFVKLSFFKNRKHKYYKGYQSYHYKELSKYFGRSNFELINDSTGLFDALPYNYGEQYTRGLKPSTKLIECFNKTIDQWLPEVEEAEHESFSKSGGIASRGVTGNKSKFKSNILQAVQVDVKALANLVKITPTNEKEMRIKAQAAVMLDLALDKTHLPKKWISQRYTEHKTGRLYSDGVSLQNCCKEVRYSALNGLYSFDIDNCHYSILAQLTKTPTPTVDHYISNKKAARTALSCELNLPVDKVKQILISLIFGASLSEFKKGNAIADICETEERYSQVLSNEFIRSLYNEVSKAGSELIKANTLKTGRHSHKVKNIMGLICDERVSSKKLSHLLQGYEVKALEVVTSITQTDTAALLHDGWVTYSNHDKGVFEKAIFEQTGLHLSVEFEIVKPTIEQPFNSAADLASNDVQEIEELISCKLIDRVELPCVYSLELITPLVDPLLIKHQLTFIMDRRLRKNDRN